MAKFSNKMNPNLDLGRVESLAPGLSKNITEDKLQAFHIGTMNMPKKPTSKKIQEEIKKKQEEIATAEIYEDFVSSFQENDRRIKTFVRGEVVNAKPDHTSSIVTAKTGQLYKPISKLKDFHKKLHEEPKPEKPVLPGKKKEKEKKKSNLELFKEELQKMQEEREERTRIKQEIKESFIKKGKADPALELWLSKEQDEIFAGMQIMSGAGMSDQWDNDPTTTNIFLANLNPKVNEEKLCELFGQYGPLASVKIMWPRTDEEMARNKNCGFVAFMNRRDGEKALEELKSVDVLGYEMKLGWGKPVPIPPHPIYIPPSMMELTLPPPPSGLPFNAQPPNNASFGNSDPHIPPPGMPLPPLEPELRKRFEKTLSKSVVKVVIPTERPLLCLIHRMIEFVIREGPRFEAMIMNRELKNPMFRFLFDNQSPAHVYYRWKLFSILNGDTPSEWRTKKFRLFAGGSYWQPPPLNPYAKGMDPSKGASGLEIKQKAASILAGLNKDSAKNNAPRPDRETVKEPEEKNLLSRRQRDRLEHMLRRLTPERDRVSQAMVFCVDHAEAAREIVVCLKESLAIPQTTLLKKLARIYLISDILFNCNSKAVNVSYFRKNFQRELPSIFFKVGETYKEIKGRLKAEQFKQKVMNCLKAWDDWNIFPGDFVCQLQNIFLGLQTEIMKKSVSFTARYHQPLLSLFNNGNNSFSKSPARLHELDGAGNGDSGGDNIDGLPLLESGNLAASKKFQAIYDDLSDEEVNTELDGAPLAVATQVSTQNVSAPVKPSGAFVSSKWEEVDEAVLEEQAMTTSKWDTLDGERYSHEVQNTPEDDQAVQDYDGEEMSVETQGFVMASPPPQGLFSLVKDKAGDSIEPSTEEKDKGLNEVSIPVEMTAEKRARLRDIELKVLKYQDDLEGCKRRKKADMSVEEQIERFRVKLLIMDQEKGSQGKSMSASTPVDDSDIHLAAYDPQAYAARIATNQIPHLADGGKVRDEFVNSKARRVSSNSDDRNKREKYREASKRKSPRRSRSSSRKPRRSKESRGASRDKERGDSKSKRTKKSGHDEQHKSSSPRDDRKNSRARQKDREGENVSSSRACKKDTTSSSHHKHKREDRRDDSDRERSHKKKKH